MHPSTDDGRLEQLVTTLTERLSRLTRALGSWVHDAPRDLQQIEQHVLRISKELGATLVAGLCALLVPAQPALTVACSCGQLARYQRQRPATVTTLLGPITLARPYYLCVACGQGQHPLDAHLQLCAGSRSAGLDELLALLGATQDSFADAATVLERLTLVHVSPNTVRDATEQLGTTLVAYQAEQATRAADGHDLPTPAQPGPAQLYITMDGVLAHLHDHGWSELKVGACYQTRSRPALTRAAQAEVRAHSLSYVTAFADAEAFGWQLWQEAVRRGVRDAAEVVVVGDGAHWIWNLAATQFPGATQILDWYHASTYVWDPATAIWGETGAEREVWAQQQLNRLWEGQVAQVLVDLEHHRGYGEGVLRALSYYTTHQARMDYAAYRARGLQLGSGCVESACKQVVSARLKQAGMIWTAAGAEAVATVRAWLKSERWQEAMNLRAAPRRGYARQRVRAEPADVGAVERAGGVGAMAAAPSRAHEPPQGGVPAAVLARVRAELAHEQGTHPWRKAWSRKQQRAQSHEHVPRAHPTRAA